MHFIAGNLHFIAGKLNVFSSFFTFHFLYKLLLSKWLCSEALARCFAKKVFLKISQGPQKNTCAGVSFIYKSQPNLHATFLKKRLRQRVFLITKFAKNSKLITKNSSDDCYFLSITKVEKLAQKLKYFSVLFDKSANGYKEGVIKNGWKKVVISNDFYYQHHFFFKLIKKQKRKNSRGFICNGALQAAGLKFTKKDCNAVM